MREGGAKYSYFDHTADVGIDIRGASDRELLENGAAALLDLIVDTERVRVDGTRTVSVRVDGIDREDVLVNWLREVLYTAQAEGFAAKSARVTSVGPTFATGEIVGEAFDSARHERREELKGVTHHGVRIEQGPDGLHARVVVDV
ncbi:MAG: archease [Planctomycetes bacterium]|nr:archease [Planctomycetota bacterium]MBI3845797.1 archease [Planctomycetota bacterium]